MSAAKPAVIVVGGTLGGGGATIGGGYALHKATVETIERKLESEGFKNVSLDTEDWKILEKKLFNGKNKETFESLKTLSVDGTSDTGELKKWCDKQRLETYQSKILPESKALLGKVKDYCFVRISEKLDSSKVLNFEGNDLNTKLTNLLSTLKSNSDSNVTLDTAENKRVKSKSLTEIKSGLGTNDDLKNWCMEAYELPYLGSSDNEFKLAGKFCISS